VCTSLSNGIATFIAHPVVAAARQDANAGRLDKDRKAIAIPFHFESPLRPFGRLWLQKRQTRLNAIRYGVEGKVWLSRISRLAWPGTNGPISIPQERL